MIYLVYSYLREGREPYTNIQLDLGLSDLQFGLVTGAGITMITAVCSLYAGHLADHTSSRTFLVFISQILANISTMLAFFAHSFLTLILTRVLFAISTSLFVPNAVSMINDMFTYQHKSKANCVFIYGIYFGICLSSLTIVLD